MSIQTNQIRSISYNFTNYKIEITTTTQETHNVKEILDQIQSNLPELSTNRLETQEVVRAVLAGLYSSKQKKDLIRSHGSYLVQCTQSAVMNLPGIATAATFISGNQEFTQYSSGDRHKSLIQQAENILKQINFTTNSESDKKTKKSLLSRTVKFVGQRMNTLNPAQLLYKKPKPEAHDFPEDYQVE